ncbi:MAG TPA: ATP-binding protein [Pyrinomonadaceae bacterium]|nr:ATP-binding protein [Pyrinomonadaceae bacterium]
MKATNNGRENRVLILMPTGRDADLVRATLAGAGIFAETCENPDKLLAAFSESPGVVLVAEEAIEANALKDFIEAVEAEPIWSDLPVIIFSSHSRNAERLLDEFGGRINVTMVERPIRVTMLVSAVRGALRARERQYQTRDLLAQLEQADKQKDLFLATLSHELRTPLNSILGWIQILRTRKLEQPEIDRAIEVIERNAKGQSEMISDILFVSRIITGKLEIKHEPVNLGEVIDGVVEMIRPSAEAKELELTVESGEYDPVPVEGDSERLQQVFLNLLTNAVKFTPDGGKIIIGLRRVGSNVLIEIRDTGQGINPQFLPYVFERFRQADSTYTRRIGGLGLGLAIVRHLVELHGGTVTAHSEGKDRGSVFTTTLPIADAGRFAPVTNGSRPTEISSELGRKVNGMNILLVEDDKDSREMLTMVLSIYGVTVECAESAAEAVEKLRQLTPDVLVSDIGLPGEDGYDLIRKVRALPSGEGGETPAIALTGYVSVQDRKLALDAGYQDHLPKPVNPNLLLELLVGLRSPRNGSAETA